MGTHNMPLCAQVQNCWAQGRQVNWILWGKRLIFLGHLV